MESQKEGGSVEVSHSRFNRFSKILVRYDKHSDSYIGLLHMPVAVIVCKKIIHC